MRNWNHLPSLGLICFIILRHSFSFVPSSTSRHYSFVSNDLSRTALFARRGGKRYQPRQVEVKPPMNNEIMASEVRVTVVSLEGKKDEALGIMSKVDAIAKAKELGNLDLILINNGDPPVCKIADYSKYRYMKEKKAKETKKQSKASETKEVKMSYKIDIHDYGVRKKNAEKFLQQGNRVKCVVVFRGREAQHDKLGFELLDKLVIDLGSIAVRDGKPKKEGPFRLSCILSPSQDVLRAISKDKREVEKEKKKKKDQTFKDRQEALDKLKEEERIVVAAALAEEEANNALAASLKEEDEEDDDVESSLDALLGSDDFTDDLFA